MNELFVNLTLKHFEEEFEELNDIVRTLKHLFFAGIQLQNPSSSFPKQDNVESLDARRWWHVAPLGLQQYRRSLSRQC